MIKRLQLAALSFLLSAPGQALAQIQPQTDARKIHSQSGFSGLNEPLEAIFKWLIIFLPTVATLYLIISGYRYIVSQGNQELVEKAKKSLLYAVYGFVIACISVALILTVSNALGFHSGL